ncbi:MAG: FtsX-like permease family protein [Myxococcota bacterium]
MFLTIAFRNLVQARRRTGILALALALVTMLLVLLLALSSGITDTMIRSATILSTGHVNLGGFFKAKPSAVAPAVKDASQLRALIEDTLPQARVVSRMRGFGRIISPTTSIQVGMTGIDVSEEQPFVEAIRLAPRSNYVEGAAEEIEGRLEDLAKPNTAMLFAAQAKRLGVQVGDSLTAIAETLQGRRNSTEIEVVAIAHDIGFLSNFSIFVHEDVVRELYHLGEDVTGVVQIYLDDYERSPQVMAVLRERLVEAGHDVMEHEAAPFFTKFGPLQGSGWTGQKLDLTTWRDEVLILTWVLTAVDTVSFALVSILLVLIGIGVMNSMGISVRERTAEIGTLRAIGMGRWSVMAMFMLEALLLGLLATGVGAAAGGLVALGLDIWAPTIPSEAVQAILMSESLHMVVRPLQLGLAVATFSGLAVSAAFFPALRAARLQPVTAIHHVG